MVPYFPHVPTIAIYIFLAKDLKYLFIYFYQTRIIINMSS